MSEQFQPDRPDFRVRNVSLNAPALPEWLQRRHLRENEHVTWVYCPGSNPPWERYVTHPGLFLAALAAATLAVAATALDAGGWTEVVTGVAFAGAMLVLVSILVLALFSGHFTRLVVTDQRLMILQGYELCRSWRMNELPMTLIRYTRRGDESAGPSIDLDAVKEMLGGSSTQIVGAKSILAFGKQLEQIKALEKDRP